MWEGKSETRDREKKLGGGDGMLGNLMFCFRRSRNRVLVFDTFLFYYYFLLLFFYAFLSRDDDNPRRVN